MADYNINAVSRKVSYTGASGLGPYAFSFEILVEGDVAVYYNETLLTITTDYTVTINANGTGEVTLVTGGSIPSTPDADDLIIILGAKDIERTTDFVTAGDLRAAALNEQLDALTIFMQQIQEEVDRSVKAPAFDPTGISMTLPKKADRVNAFVAFDANGDISAAVPSDDVTTLAEVATDIKTLADIEDGTDATDAIQTVAGISSDVSTVSGISGNVTTVAGNTSNINAVAADATDIGTVATNIASVNTVATNISDVVTVANDLNEAISEIETAADDLNEAVSEIDTVATNIANVNTVGTNIANVNTVAGINSDVTAVAADATDIGTVSTNIANVNTVAGISGNVTTVAGISADVTTVAADGTDIGTVATNIANVNTTATNIANVNTAATNIANVNTVAGISADVTTVAADGTDIGTVAGISADVQTLADIEDGTVATDAISDLAAIETELVALHAQLSDLATKVNRSGDTLTGDLIFNTTGALTLPVGTEAQRPTPVKGMFRFNDDDDEFEGYNGTEWGAIAGGGGSVTTNGLFEHAKTISANYSITSGNNAIAAGPVDIDTGVTVTIPSGSRWAIV